MRLAITGTPGCGKTAVADALRERGVPVLDLAQLAQDCGAVVGLDDARGSLVVDEEILADAWETAAVVLEGAVELVACEGHYAHDMRVDAVAILRCEPLTLAARLRARGWPEAKVRENVEAEAMGIIAGEVEGPAFEVDTTRATVDETARAAARGRGARVDPGRWDVGALPWV